MTLVQRWSPPLALAGAALAIEVLRTAGMREAALPAAVLGGVGLCLLALGRTRDQLGLAPGRPVARLVGAAALTAVLLLPAAVRWTGQAPLSGWFALAAVAIAAGEELAFRGALFSALETAVGPVGAVLGSSLAWTAAHAVSHPLTFLPAVFTAGLVLGLWRSAMRDLAAPIAAHALADIAL